MFEKVQKEVEIMVEMFKRCHFLLNVASKQNYEEGFKFTENNIVGYLAELEEYICALITYSAWKLNAPNHATSFIPFEVLNVKDHDKKEMTVSRIVHSRSAGTSSGHVRRCGESLTNFRESGNLGGEEQAFAAGRTPEENYRNVRRRGQGSANRQ